MKDLSKLFRPRSVAIVGASDKNPWSGQVARSLSDLGFRGRVHLVNRRGTPALGRETFKSCAELESVDAAFVAVPSVALLDAIEDMAAGGIRYGAVVTSGFAEIGGDGAHEQSKIFGRARELGVMLLGPNSLGFSNFVDRVSLSAIPIKIPLLDGPRVGLVSQSGATAAMIYAFAHQQNVSLSYSIAMGNEALLDFSDVIHFLIEDEATRAIAVFAETIRDPRNFESAAQAAAAAGKPIVMLKVGTGELTAAIAQAHTGALVGDDRVFQAVCDAFNIVRVNSMEDLVVTADLLAATAPIDPAKGFSLISISGGACEIFADRGEEVGIQFPAFGTETLERLSGVLADFGAAHNPLDLTGAAMRNPEIYSGAIQAITQDPAIGLIGIVAEIPSSPGPAAAISESALRAITAGLSASDAGGVVIQQVIKPVSDYGREVIGRHGLSAVTGGLDHAVRAVGSLYAWSRRAGSVIPAERTAAVKPVTIGAAGAHKPVTERAVLEYLATAGVPVIPQHVVKTGAEAIAAARVIAGAVVLKVLSPDIQHKTEVGGVVLNVFGDEAVGVGFEQIMASVSKVKPLARIDGILVSPMRTNGVELIVGIVRDPIWGLAMVIGMGGIWVELLKDTCLKVLPVTALDAREMLGRLNAARLLQGYRGAKPVDLGALSKVIETIGNAALALGDQLEALEINPLYVDGASVEALDAVVVWKTPCEKAELHLKSR